MPITDRVRWLLGLLLVLLAGTAFAAPAPVPAPASTVAPLRVGVMTMLPGEIFWERFGHDALIIDDPARGPPISYNFGFFDPSEPDFVGRFIRGRMRYQLVALPLADDLAYYRSVGRGVFVQWLDLSPAQARSLADALAVNALPQHARYDYDYFTDNCATRVRDALDRALGGQLQAQLSARSRGNTYRSEAVRLASPAPWMWLGFDVGLGPFADVPLARWQEGFVPMRLADSLREATGTDGRPLVVSEQRLLPHRLPPEPAEGARPWWPWFLWGLAGALALVWLGRRSPRVVAALALPFWTLCSLLGALMLFIWFGTAHRAGWSNQNLLLFNPLSLALLPGAWRIARGRQGGGLFDGLLILVAVCATAAWIMRWLPFPWQDNTHWIACLLPLHLAVTRVLRRR